MRFKKDDRLFGHTNYKNGIAESATRFDSTGARIDHFNYTTIEGDFRLKDRTIIVDDKEVLFMVLDDKDVHANYDVGIWMDTPYFSKAMNDMFDVVWNKLEDGQKVIAKLGK